MMSDVRPGGNERGTVSGDVTTEARILEVASRLFYERGYKATTTRDLAEEVGIKAASLYNHFSSKQAILVRICLDTMREFHAGALQCLQGIDDPAQRLRTLVDWQVRFEAGHPYTASVADGQLEALNRRSRNELIQLRDAYEEMITSTLIAGCEQGVWRVEHPRIITLGIVSMTKIDPWYREGGPLSPEQIGDIYFTFILGALQSSAPR
jgi:AcrR family transcriptional regulator